MTAAICEQEPWLTTGGIPIVNGEVYFGIRNTDPVANPISIFSDRELTVALTNPQPTDAYGKTLKKVWLSGQYSVEVYNSNNVLQYQDLDRGSASSESGGGVTELTTADSPYDLQATDSGLVFVINATAGAFIFNLLGAVAAGSAFDLVVKKSPADVSTNPITIDGNGAELIEGQTTLVISETARAVGLQCTGSISTASEWFIKSDAVDNFDTITVDNVVAEAVTADGVVIEGSATNLNPTIRINSEDGLKTSFILLSDTDVGTAVLQKHAASGNSFLFLDAIPLDTTSAGILICNAGVNTAGLVAVQFARGDGTSTVDHQIISGASGDLVLLCQNGGNATVRGIDVFEPRITEIETVNTTSGLTAESATIDFAALAADGFRDLIIKFNNVSGTDATGDFVVDVSDDDGVGWSSAASSGLLIQYNASGGATDFIGATTVAVDVPIASTVVGHFSIENFSASDTDLPKKIDSSTSFSTFDAAGNGMIEGFAEIDKVRMRVTNGTFDAGSYTIFART